MHKRNRKKLVALVALAAIAAAIAAGAAYAYFVSTGATNSSTATITASSPPSGNLLLNPVVYGGGSTTQLVLGGTATYDAWVHNTTGASITVNKVGLDPAFTSHGMAGVTGFAASCPADVSSWFTGPDVSFGSPTTVPNNGDSGHASFVLTLLNAAVDQSCLLGSTITVHLITK